MNRKGRKSRGAENEDDDEVLEEEEDIETEYTDGDGVPLATAKQGNRVIVFAKTHQYKLWLILGCGVLILLLFIFLYWGWFDNYRSYTTHHMHELDQRLTNQQLGRGGLSVGQSGIYSLAAVTANGLPATLALCHRDYYDTGTRDGRQYLVRSDRTARAVSLAERRATALPKSYQLNLRLEVNYNVVVPQHVLRQNGLSEKQRYETLHYEVGSTYGQFSTIKLLVSTEDISRGTPRVRQEVVVCSDRPGGERPCSLRVTLKERLLMNNTLLFAMEQPARQSDPQLPQRSVAPSDSAVNTASNDPQEEQEEIEQGVDLVEHDRENLRGLEAEMANNRQFHMIFYRETPRTTSTATTSRDDAEEFSEYIVLAVEPAMC